MNLYLLQYNNYYNRLLKRENTLNEYKQYSPFAVLGIRNFNYADGVSTQQTVNYDWDPALYGMPDYAVLVDDEENVVCRYFIIDMVYQCKGQYVATIYRDLVADYYLELLNAPIFIEKGPLADSDTFIYNNEDMTFNQIKQDEILLKDRSNVSWLVGYMTRDNQVNGETTTPWSFKFKRDLKPDAIYPNISAYPYADGQMVNKLVDYSYTMYCRTAVPGQTENIVKKLSWNINGPQLTAWPNSLYVGIGPGDRTLTTTLTSTPASIANLPNILPGLSPDYATGYQTIKDYRNFSSDSQVSALASENGKIILDQATGRYVRINVVYTTKYLDLFVAPGTTLYSQIDAMAGATGLFANRQESLYQYGFLAKYTQIQIVYDWFEGQPIDEKTINIPLGRNVLQDAPYCMFAIPYTAKYILVKDGGGVCETPDEATTLDFITSMISTFKGAEVIYDVQLLPYCPIQQRLNEAYDSHAVGGKCFDLSGMTQDVDYQIIQTEGTKGIPVIWCEYSTFSFDIQRTITNPASGPYAMKIWNECYTYRLSSPNYASSFEFSAAKNLGVQWFNVDCSYKPYQPYIHVNPNFEGLYGLDFNDARGLICSGDFSISQVVDAWETYQLQNINFEKSFQRQIENMEVKNKYQKAQEITGAVMGTLQAGISGGMTGALVGGPIGAGIGAGVGTVASAAAGVADVYINEKLRAEALDFTKDQFGYQLGNIQALPTTISKVSAFTANNKIFPVLEIYGANYSQIEAFINKLKYNGATVMRIGTLNEFISYKRFDRDYFKGKLIRMEDVAEDFHIINALSAELDKGVFI